MNKALHVFLFACASTASAQEDNFNDGDDDGWTRLAPLAALGGTEIGVENGRYAISCEPSPAPQETGPARAGAVLAGRTYSKFCVMADFVSSSTAGDLSAGVMARVQPEPGPGNVNGYALTAQLHGGDIQISRITGEVAHDIGSADVT